MQNTLFNISIRNGIWDESDGNWLWASELAEFGVDSLVDGILSFSIAVPKNPMHETALPVDVEFFVDDKSIGLKSISKPGGFRLQVKVKKGQDLNIKIVSSKYIIPDDFIKNCDYRKLSVTIQNFTLKKISEIENITPFEYLIYSSHKTATQSILSSLHFNKINSYFCHRLDDLSLIGLFDNIVDKKSFIVDLKMLADWFYQVNKKPIKIISVYRPPESRLISSFFQTHGSDLIQFGGKNREETPIYQFRDNIDSLIKIFNDYLYTENLDGYFESIESIFEELDISYTNIRYDPDKLVIKLIDKKYILYLTRFDILTKKFQKVMEAITGKALTVKPSNLSENKWYFEIYNKFKTQYSYPKDLENKIYLDKSKLHNIFYGKQSVPISQCR